MTAADHAHHPGPRQYWMIGGLLAVITAVEVAVSYVDFLGVLFAPTLIGLGIAKFAIVARWFMHLKFDKPLYSRFFLIGIVGAILLFSVVLFTFGLLIDS